VECFRIGDKEEGFGRCYKEKRLKKKGHEECRRRVYKEDGFGRRYRRKVFLKKGSE
jgi:hypothetical protein